MLSRVAARSATSARAAALLRSPVLTRTALPAAVLSLSTIWSRGMAKDNKPRFGRPDNPPAQKASVNATSSRPASEARSKPAAPRPATPSKPEPVQTKADKPVTAPPSSQSQPPKESDITTSSQTQPPTESGATTEPDEPIDLSKLPDLTQGLPSTLAYEMAGATDKAALAEVEEEAPGVGKGRKGKGELPASAYISSSERRQQKTFNRMFGAVIVGLVGGTVYLGREWDEEEQAKNPEIPNGWSLTSWWNRARARMGHKLTYYHEPAFEKLLPDPQPSFERPYTLCISLEDMLVHNEWTREHGWRVAKRPGADYFIRYLSQYYEIVLFTTVPFAFGETLVRKLDPFHFIMWPLFREATKYKDGEIVKDLSYLNRDLSKVLIIDTEPKHVRAQPENAIILPKWKGDPKDTELVSLIPFLEYIHTMQYGDVRKVLQSFEGKHIPTEFARREAIARAEFNKQIQAQKGKSASSKSNAQGGGMGMLAGLLGLKPSKLSMMVVPEGEEDPQEAFAKGKMLQDIARERGKRNYEMIEKEIRENGEKWLKEEAEAMEKAQKEAMANMKGSFTGWFGVKQEEPKPATDAAEEK